MCRKAAVIIGIILLFTTAIIHADENTDQAWQALSRKEYSKAREFTRKCLKKSKTKARQQKDLIEKAKTQKNQDTELLSEGVLTAEADQNHAGFARMLANKELNDTATSEFIEAESLKGEGKRNEARKKYADITRDYQHAYCWDPRGWYWNIAEVAQDKLDTMDTNYDYGDYRSETLTVKAWESLKQKDTRGIELYAKKCIKLYEKKARAMKAGLSAPPAKEAAFANWALNDVATCYYIQGERHLSAGDQEKAKEMFGKAAELGFAVCWDPRGWHWNVAEVAKDKLDNIGTKYEYGDYKSKTLTAKAWKCLEEKDHQGLDKYTRKCIYLFEKEAGKMKTRITTDPEEGKESENWALNDIATCYYLQGEKLRKEGKPEEARQIYGKVKEFKHAFCWNPKGWYFNVSEAAQDRLDTMGTPYDYDDYQSKTLTAKAWKSNEEKDAKGVDLYTRKCIRLFEKEANKMKAVMTSDPVESMEAVNWALNDVATCYYLQGEKLLAEGKTEEARKRYSKAKEFTYAMCWNPEGWYFNVAEAAQDRLATIGTKYDFGDYKSETLTTKTWQSLADKDYLGISLYAAKCIRLFSKQALKMEQSFISDPVLKEGPENWALNDVATCYFILGRGHEIAANYEQAKKMYEQCGKLSHAVCLNLQGLLFNVAGAAQDRIDLLGTNYDYEDYTSQTLAKKSWESLSKKDYQGVEIYANKCIQLYEAEAQNMQSLQTTPINQGAEAVNWALNDVATCYYLLGEIYLVQAQDAKAKEMYQKASALGFSLCWDPQGWYFKVGETAQDKLDLWGTPYDYGNYRSVTLTNKAWQALNSNDYQGVELYAKKCAYLYEEKAKAMQGELSSFAKPGFAPYYWALNDVGTCYFILGEAYQKQGNKELAKAAYQTAIEQFCYAQCWDPRGWYWKVSVVALNKLKDIQ